MALTFITELGTIYFIYDFRLEVTAMSALSGIGTTTTTPTTRVIHSGGKIRSSLAPWVYGRTQIVQQEDDQQRIFFNVFNALFRTTTVSYTTYITGIIYNYYCIEKQNIFD